MEKEENAKTQKKTKKDASKEQITFSYFSYLIITNKLLFIYFFLFILFNIIIFIIPFFHQPFIFFFYSSYLSFVLFISYLNAFFILATIKHF